LRSRSHSPSRSIRTRPPSTIRSRRSGARASTLSRWATSTRRPLTPCKRTASLRPAEGRASASETSRSRSSRRPRRLVPASRRARPDEPHARSAAPVGGWTEVANVHGGTRARLAPSEAVAARSGGRLATISASDSRSRHLARNRARSSPCASNRVASHGVAPKCPRQESNLDLPLRGCLNTFRGRAWALKAEPFWVT